MSYRYRIHTPCIIPKCYVLATGSGLDGGEDVALNEVEVA